ncbi:unnamed protein product [Tetraodon nigroviridis]|uniref:(spotted green pufferfish) hypothetical protein n=1 Tax=Tetraodon nigroviridis TaxID=99883 RepID=Q4TBK3_TETNG|nr:unnamed protein product [Tetraodon nigroviridis]
MSSADDSRSARSGEPSLFAVHTYRLLAAAIGAIGVLGFCNNLAVAALYWRFRRLRTPTNLLLLNISLSDLLVSLLGVNFTFAACVQGRWTWNQATCVWDGFSNSLFGESARPVRVCRVVFGGQTGGRGRERSRGPLGTLQGSDILLLALRRFLLRVHPQTLAVVYYEVPCPLWRHSSWAGSGVTLVGWRCRGGESCTLAVGFITGAGPRATAIAPTFRSMFFLLPTSSKVTEVSGPASSSLAWSCSGFLPVKGAFPC